jgi:serine/threonine-protein kinase
MDFISRDALIQAMNAWILQKQKPLGEILHEQAALGESERSVLEALVEKHLERHRHDARESLAAVGAGPAIRAELSQIPDGDIQASLSSIFSTRATALDWPTSPHIQNDQVGTRYRLVRSHAKGGLGEVFVAVDLELNREVALKKIQAERDHDAQSRGRFLLEAEITGGLEHPGVVPVYGLGRFDDGRPYYAMRFIKGETLQEAIRCFHEADMPGRNPGERRLALRQLLGQFIAVCNTVAYAHSRGVLHRDLKPANIMLGKYAETLVIDWGLAKAIGRPESARSADEASLRPSSGSGLAATQAGSAVGTPSYMSPEQAAGKWDFVSPASDIYSLGATLYALLTGHAPFRGSDAGTILERVKRGDFPPPRQVNPQTPLGLDAICRKAMALSPQDRYATAQELVADVEHWLADEPVSAWTEPRSARLGRWMRRHRAGVVGAVAALVAVIICLGASTGFLLAAYREANRQRSDANTQRERAATRFSMARQAVDDFQTKISDNKELKERGLEPLRQKLLQSAADFYQRFVEEEATDVEVQAEQGRAHWRLAALSASLGETERARLNDEAALAIFQRLANEYPEDIQYQYDLVLVHSNMGMMHHRAGRSKEAEKEWLTTRDMCEALVKREPKDLNYQHKLGTTWNNLGSLYWMNSDFKSAEPAYDEVLKTYQRLVAAEPNDLQYHLAYADSFSNLGLLYTMTGRHIEAEKAFENALKIHQRLYDDHPRDTEYQLALGRTYNSLGNLYSNTSRPLLAIKPFEQARDLQQQLIAAHALVIEYQLDLVVSHDNLGDSYCDIGRLDLAQESYKEGEKLCRRLMQIEPNNIEYVAILGGNEAGQALLFGENGELQKSAAQFDAAIGRLDQILKKTPKQVWANQLMPDALLGRAQVRARLGATAGAQKDLERSLTFGLAKDDPKYQTARAAILVRAGKVARRWRKRMRPLRAVRSSAVVYTASRRCMPSPAQKTPAKPRKLCGCWSERAKAATS